MNSKENISDDIVMTNFSGQQSKIQNNGMKNFKIDIFRKNIEVKCQWAYCNKIFITSDKWLDFQIFENHILEHTKEFMDQNTNKTHNLFTCKWKECKYSVSILKTLDKLYHQFKHLCQHAHHEYLMGVGKLYSEMKGLPTCRSKFFYAPVNFSSFVCKWKSCSVNFSENYSPTLFFSHVENHIEIIEGKYIDEKFLYSCEWGDCEMKTERKDSLKNHYFSHLMKKYAACSNCGKCFSSGDKMVQHIIRQPLIDGIYECYICLLKFDDEEVFESHIKKHIKNFSCEFCSHVCSSNSSLRRHILYCHNSHKSFICLDCEKEFKTKYDLNRHMRLHDKNAYYETVTDKTFGCHMCSKTFTRAYQVKLHLMKLHNIKRELQGRNEFEMSLENGIYYLKK